MHKGFILDSALLKDKSNPLSEMIIQFKIPSGFPKLISSLLK